MSETETTELSRDDVLPHGLTLRQKLFVEHYLSGVSATEAIRLAKYNCSSRKSMSEIGRNLLRNPRVLKYLADLLTPPGFECTADYIQKQIHREALTGENNAARVRCWELLAKYRGMDVNRIEVNVLHSLSLDEMSEQLEQAKEQEFALLGQDYVNRELISLVNVAGFNTVRHELDSLASTPTLIEHVG